MSFKILFAGDFVYSNNPQKLDFEISKEYKEIIRNHNVFCCNLEGPIVNDKCNKIRKIGPNIHNNGHAVKKLVDNGCNLFCMANNHIFDYGKEGIKTTIDFLEQQKVSFVGAGLNKEDIYSPYILKHENYRICIINIAENGFGAAIDKNYGYTYAFDDRVREIINKYKKICEYVIVVSHMGAEHWSIPLPEVRKFYKDLVDWGVDAVIAHHPHVPQGWEIYKEKIICYSLGNFIFDKGKGIQNASAYSVSIEFMANKKIKYNIIPTKFENYKLNIDSEDYLDLCNILQDNLLYKKILNENISKSYANYKNTYYKVVSYDRGNIKERFKGFVKRNILRKKFQDIWLYHNLNIETHMWVCKRATREIIESDLEENN